MSGENDRDDDKIASLEDARRRKILLQKQAANDVHEPMINLPPAVKVLSLVNIAVFGMMWMLSQDSFDEITWLGGFVAARYSGDLPFGIEAVFSPFTYMFIHNGFLHLAVNVGTLMAFGAGLEKFMGVKKMLVLYFVTGLFGAVTHFVFFPHLQGPLVGASGSISGLFGGVLMMMYYSGALGSGLSRILPLILVWIGITFFFGIVNVPGNDAPIGWTAHVGGFLAGLAFFRPIMRSKIF